MEEQVSQFYRELVEQVEHINRTHPESKMSLRKAILNGLNLSDPFTGKIRTGRYRPTLERLKNLAEYLGVPPTTFTVYTERVVEDMLESQNPHFLELAKVIAEQPKHVSDILMAGLAKQARAAVDRGTEQRRLRAV